MKSSCPHVQGSVVHTVQWKLAPYGKVVATVVEWYCRCLVSKGNSKSSNELARVIQ